MVIADISFVDVIWSIIMVFFFVIFLWMVFGIIGDIFRSDDLSGGMKAVWCIALVVIPFLTIFIYLIARGKGMAERQIKAQQAAQAQFNAYVKEQAGSGGPASEIAEAKSLLDSGTITQDEFDRIKAAAIAKA